MDFWATLITFIVVAVSAFIWRRMTYFRNTGISYTPPLPVLGNMASVLLQRKHFVVLISDMYKKYRDVPYYGFYDLIDPVVVIRDPELIKSIAVKNFDSFMNHKAFADPDVDPLFGKSLFGLKGTRWREIRQLLTPAFTASKMKAMSGLMSKCAVNFSDHVINETAKDGEDVQIKDAFLRFTNDVIASCAFGISVDSMKNPDNEFYVLGKRATNFDGFTSVKFFVARIFPKLMKIFNVQLFDKQMTKFFQNVIQSTIETREKDGIVRPDMLQLMIDSKSRDANLTIEEMTAQAFLFFFGGFDSSANLMSFTALQLSVCPDIQKRLQEEVDEVMERTNGDPSYEAINSMTYMEAVLYEALRYWPIAGFMDRVCEKSFELPPSRPGGKPFTIEAGVNVWFPSGAIHMDPKYYPDPEKFDPERFLDNKVTSTMSTYLAFGMGPRACIGNRFALLECKLVLFHLLARCNLKQSPKLKVPITLSKNTFSVIPDGGFWIKLEKRKSKEV